MEIISCGILKEEIHFLIQKNGWKFQERYLDSSLHINYDALEKSLKKSMNKVDEPPALIIYGTCHPLIDNFCEYKGSLRTDAQNCVEMLLGRERFQEELQKGAFFLMEDWAYRWEKILPLSLGKDKSLWREIFAESHKYLLAIKTICSGDFSGQAEKLSRDLNLPLQWLETDLRNLESLLVKTMASLEKKSYG